MGATAGRDVESAVHSHMTNTLNTPIEALEYAYPFLVKEYSIRRGTLHPKSLSRVRHSSGQVKSRWGRP